MTPTSPDHPTIEPTSQRLRLIPLDDTVVFPNMGITLTIDVGEDERVVLVPRHENEFLEVGTIAEVSEQIRLPGGGRAVDHCLEPPRGMLAQVGAVDRRRGLAEKLDIAERAATQRIDRHRRAALRAFERMTDIGGEKVCIERGIVAAASRRGEAGKADSRCAVAPLAGP